MAIKFDLTAIPSDATILDARLSLYIWKDEWPGDNATYGCYRIGRAWNTSEATWTKATSSTNWSSGGGDVDGGALATSKFSGADPVDVWDSYDVAVAVRQFVAGTKANHGFLIKPDSGPHDAHKYRSSRYATINQRPKLVVRYTSPSTVAPPALVPADPQFCGWVDVSIKTNATGGETFYTLDGTVPTRLSTRYSTAFRVSSNQTVTARTFTQSGQSAPVSISYVKVPGQPAASACGTGASGLTYRCFAQESRTLKQFVPGTVARTGTTTAIGVTPADGMSDPYVIEYTGFLRVTYGGYYRFATTSDDGSVLYLGGTLVVDNDGGHAAQTVTRTIALEPGCHQVRILYSQLSGGEEMAVACDGPEVAWGAIPPSMLQVGNSTAVSPTARSTRHDPTRGVQTLRFTLAGRTVPDVAGPDGRVAPAKTVVRARTL